MAGGQLDLLNISGENHFHKMRYGTLKYAFHRTHFEVKIYIYIDQICIEVFEKTIRRTEIIDHLFERKFYGALKIGYIKMFREGLVARSARTKL